MRARTCQKRSCKENDDERVRNGPVMRPGHAMLVRRAHRRWRRGGAVDRWLQSDTRADETELCTHGAETE